MTHCMSKKIISMTTNPIIGTNMLYQVIFPASNDQKPETITGVPIIETNILNNMICPAQLQKA
jgi:hypothetical protein